MCEENDREFQSLLIQSMRWSFSRLDSFDDCPYAWKLRYLDGNPDCGSCFSSYGSACHKTLEEWEKGQVDIFTICDEYDRLFNEYITQDFPPSPSGDMRSSYYQKGYDYFSSLTDELEDIEILGVEEKVEFEIAGKPFIGFIDLRYRDKDGNMVCLDHKSSGMKLGKRNGQPLKAYKNKMKRYERQQYLYTIPFVEKGEKVDRLRWNFFKEGFHYEIPWTEEGYHEAIKWAEDTLKKIESATEFEPVYVTRKTKDGKKIEPEPGYMFCNYICGQRKICDKKYAMFINEEKD